MENTTHRSDGVPVSPASQESREEKHFTFTVQGMTCASCVNIVETALRKVPGVHLASVNLATGKTFVMADADVSYESLAESVSHTGYTPLKEKPSEDMIERQFKKARHNMFTALAVTVPLMILMFFHMAGKFSPGMTRGFYWLELLLGGFVIFGIGFETLKGAWIALSHKHTNMDTLISLGILASWSTTALTLTGLPIFSFGTIGAMILAFHLTGRYLEARLKQKASRDLEALLSFHVDEANVITPEGTQAIPTEAVKPGARILVRSGERIPLDGIILEGEGSIDESMITGEPLPVRKGVKAEVTGGTLLEKGVLQIEVTRVGEDSFLSQMVKLIEEAQSSKVPIQAFADKVIHYFIPVVFFLSLFSGILWTVFYPVFSSFLQSAAHILPWINPSAGALSTGIFVFVASLVIACPCALGLATPMALVAGSGAAARRGLIIKNGETIQQAKNISTVLFDKTGTITEGKPRVIESTLSPAALSITAALEGNSVHPLAQAVIDYAQDKKENREGSSPETPAFTRVEEIAGEGIQGELPAGSQSDRWFIGRPQDPKRPEYVRAMEQGSTVIEVRKNEASEGYLVIQDPVKKDSARAVAQLQKLNLLPIMLTGDQKKTALSVARQVGIETVIAEVRPQDKLNAVRDAQKKGEIVAMAGDGINDAAALKGADIGIAMGTGTDLSMESGDIIITKGNLNGVADAIDISRLTFRKIRQNLIWAFLYNIIALPLAMLGLLHPALAELAMLLSSICVILNSSAIRNYRH